MCAFYFISSSDPPLSEEDIPAGLWLCHMCQMLQKQRTSSASSNFNLNEMQKFKDSRPSTPINSDGVINAAKIRLSQKRSSSRVSSCSENSNLSSDREIKSKISRSNSDQCSNGTEMIDSCEYTPTNVDGKESEAPIELNEDVQSDTIEPLVDESDCKTACEDISYQPVVVLIKDDSLETGDVNTKIESQIESTPNVETIDLESEIECESKIQAEIETETEAQPEIETETETKPETNLETEKTIINGGKMEVDTNDEHTEQNGNEEVVTLKSPLDELIRAATILNPRQFELPRELAIFPQFPGDEKSK